MRAFQLDDRHVAAGVGADQLPAIEFAVGQAAPAFEPSAADDVVVRQGVAGGVVDDAAPAAAPVVAVDRHDRAIDRVDSVDPGGFGGLDGRQFGGRNAVFGVDEGGAKHQGHQERKAGGKGAG